MANGNSNEDGGKWFEFEKFISVCLKQIDCICLMLKKWAELLCKAESTGTHGGRLDCLGRRDFEEQRKSIVLPHNFLRGLMNTEALLPTNPMSTICFIFF